MNFNSLMKDIESHFVGFESLFNDMSRMQRATGFPPYNIVKNGDNKYSIELAVAGFGKQDIDIELDGDMLTVSGKVQDETSPLYIWQGLAKRAFKRQFTINDKIQVKGASLVNGFLKIALEKVAEDKKVTKIDITDEPSTVGEYASSNPQLLSESDLEATFNNLK